MSVYFLKSIKKNKKVSMYNQFKKNNSEIFEHLKSAVKYL